jgi:chorismate dehydratase
MIRLGAVSYLNVRPLVYGLERSVRFSLRYDVPSLCATLLDEGAIDLGMIPSIEALRGGYRLVPDLGIISDGPVASVAVFTRVPLDRVRRLGLDTSSRTSAGLTRVLCREAWNIEPELVSVSPDAAARLDGCDAALLIGDPALFLDHEAAGFQKVDLGAEWTSMTGLPFVWAAWAGRDAAVNADGIAELRAARDAGIRHTDEIADDYCGPARAPLGRRYLRENMKYRLGGREAEGLQRYYDLAARHGIVERSEPIRFFEAGGQA